MASPVFSGTREDLKKILRLTHVQPGDPTDSVLDEAIENARAGFIRRLGISRVTEIASYALVEDPQTENEGLRFVARNCERLWVRHHLLLLLSARTLEGSGDVQQNWDYEGFLRSTSSEDRIKLLTSMLDEVARMLDRMEAPSSIAIGGESKVNATVFTPETMPPLPYQSAFPGLAGVRQGVL